MRWCTAKYPHASQIQKSLIGERSLSDVFVLSWLPTSDPALGKLVPPTESSALGKTWANSCCWAKLLKNVDSLDQTEVLSLAPSVEVMADVSWQEGRIFLRCESFYFWGNNPTSTGPLVIWAASESPHTSFKKSSPSVPYPFQFSTGPRAQIQSPQGSIFLKSSDTSTRTSWLLHSPQRSNARRSASSHLIAPWTTTSELPSAPTKTALLTSHLGTTTTTTLITKLRSPRYAPISSVGLIPSRRPSEASL